MLYYNIRNKENQYKRKEENEMTAEEMKTLLNEKCQDSWDRLKIVAKEYGQKSVQAEKALTKWVTYEDLFRELYNETPKYSYV